MTIHGTLLPEIADPRYWISHSNGRVYRLTDMIGEHLMSAIAMVERGRDAAGSPIPEWCKDKLPYLTAEALKRGLINKNDGWDA